MPTDLPVGFSSTRTRRVPDSDPTAAELFKAMGTYYLCIGAFLIGVLLLERHLGAGPPFAMTINAETEIGTPPYVAIAMMMVGP